MTTEGFLNSWSGQVQYEPARLPLEENRSVSCTLDYYYLRIWGFCETDPFQIQTCYSFSRYNGRVRMYQRTSWRGIHRLRNEVLFSWRTCHYKDHPHSKCAHFLHIFDPAHEYYCVLICPSQQTFGWSFSKKCFYSKMFLWMAFKIYNIPSSNPVLNKSLVDDHS